jgi:hypothetical protein
MPDILFLTDPSPDYGPDYLYDGFCELLGDGHVIDWPPKPSLHLSEGAPATFDCDLHRPQHDWSAERVAQALRDGTFAAVIVPTVRGEVRSQLRSWARAGLLNASRDRLVAYDAEDHPHNTQPLFTECLGAAPVAYFKRELPVGANWATSLPFGYPASRQVPVGEREPSVVYSAHLWDWCTPDSTRAQLREGLRELGVVMPPDGSRWDVAENHAANRSALIAVSPAGLGYHTNRHLEIIADGCCPVLEDGHQPRAGAPCGIQGLSGIVTPLFRTADKALRIVQQLLADSIAAHALAEVAQAWWLRHHTTRHRAETVWCAIHSTLPEAA